MEDLTGRQFGPYQIVAPLGEGGMAAVYKAYQPSMERYVAVKVLPRQMANSEEFIARFKREARLLAQLQHPHILSVFDYGESEGFTYIVMPFIQSGTLADLLKTRRLGLAEIRRITSQIGDALGYAHARGMIHRDVKPSNVLIDERGNCLLTDFGLARMSEATSKLTSSGAIMGTPAYMSPEQGTGGAVDGRSDLYSLGVILYEMITGRVPYAAETPIAIVFKHIQDPLPPARSLVPDLSEELELVLLKALAKSPADRYQSAEDLVQAIQLAIPANSTSRPAPAAPLATVIAPPAHQPGPVSNQPTMLEPVSRPPSTPPVAAPLSSYPTPSQVSARSISQPQIQPGKRNSSLWALAGVGVVGIGLVFIVILIVGYNLLRNYSPKTNPAPTNPPPTTVSASSTETPLSPTDLPAALTILPGSHFQDDFTDQLADGWNWEAEDPAKWSLSKVPGSLQLIATDTSLDGGGLPTNLLLREAPAGDFEIHTRLKFAPQSNFQFAGFVVFQDQGNALLFGRAFCDDPDSCVGNGFYYDNYEDGNLSGPNFKTKFQGDEVFLGLRRTGNTYSAFFSLDGNNWTLIGAHTRDFSAPRIGLLAAQAQTEIPAAFDFFALDELPTVTVNTEAACLAAPETAASSSAVFKAGTQAPILGISQDGQWLSVQNPEKTDEACWLAFENGDLGQAAAAVPILEPTPVLVAPPTVVVPVGKEFVRINQITIDAQNHYVVEYETFGYTEKLPGEHVHFYFNTVPQAQAGMPGKGPWIVYGGPRPFTRYRTSDRPKNASQICALVANPDHSIQPESGNCFPLPDVPTVTARTETACLDVPNGQNVATFPAGSASFLRGFSSDGNWLSIQNPLKVDNSSCWVPLNSSVQNGDTSQVPIVNP